MGNGVEGCEEEGESEEEENLEDVVSSGIKWGWVRGREGEWGKRESEGATVAAVAGTCLEEEDEFLPRRGSSEGPLLLA